MNKEIFLSELKERLCGLPKDDIEERIAFYSEMINDRIEDGLSEEEAVAEMGDIDSVVKQIMAEIPLSTLVKEKVKPKRKLKVWEIVLLVLGSPVWLPVGISALAVIFSLYVTVWSVVLCVYAVDVTFLGCTLGGLAGIAVYLKSGSFSGALFSAGIGIASAGLAILLFFASVWITKKIIQATNRLLVNIKYSFAFKGE